MTICTSTLPVVLGTPPFACGRAAVPPPPQPTRTTPPPIAIATRERAHVSLRIPSSPLRAPPRTRSAEQHGWRSRSLSRIIPGVFPYALLAGAQVAIGAAAIFARFALTGAQPLAVAALRLLVAAAILLVVMGIRPLSVRISRKENLRLAAAGLALGAHFGLWIASLQYTPVALSTLLVTTTPLWTALYDAVVLRRPLSVRTRSAFTTGAAGLAATVAFDRVPAPVPHHARLG